MTEGRKPEYPEKTPDDELQKMTQCPKIQAPAETRTRCRIGEGGGEVRKADVLTITPRAALSIGGRLEKQTC